MKGNVLVGQSGGPTSVINASLAGVITAAQRAAGSETVGEVLGMRFAIEGFLQGHTVPLGAVSGDRLALLERTPASALGSCRYKLADEDLPAILRRLEEFDIRYLFYIGGNDTMDTIHRIEAYCRQEGYEIRGIGIPKTVDNDLFATDHTPGYPSAARYVALSVRQAGRLASDMRHVDQFVVHQTVGREAGWLAAASALARRAPHEAPHIIYTPERPLTREGIIEDVENAHREHGFVSIVVGEGIVWEDGSPVSAGTSRDRFANVEFGAMGGTSAAFAVHCLVSDHFGFRGEFQIPESLAMAADDRVVDLDRAEARRCGENAVERAMAGESGVMVTIERAPDEPYRTSIGTAPLREVAVRAKPMPEEYLEPGWVSERFLQYARPLVGEMPEYFTVEGNNG